MILRHLTALFAYFFDFRVFRVAPRLACHLPPVTVRCRLQPAVYCLPAFPLVTRHLSLTWKSEGSSLTIDLLAMTDLHHDDRTLLAINLVDHAVIAHADSVVRFVSMKFLGASGNGVCGQAVNVGPQRASARTMSRVCCTSSGPRLSSPAAASILPAPMPTT